MSTQILYQKRNQHQSSGFNVENYASIAAAAAAAAQKDNDKHLINSLMRYTRTQSLATYIRLNSPVNTNSATSLQVCPNISNMRHPVVTSKSTTRLKPLWSERKVGESWWETGIWVLGRFKAFEQTLRSFLSADGQWMLHWENWR